MPILPIIAALALLTKMGTDVSKAHKADKYKKKMEQFEKEQIEKQHKQQLGKAVGSTMPGYTPFAPRKQDPTPEASSTIWEDTLGGVAGGIGSLAAMNMGGGGVEDAVGAAGNEPPAGAGMFNTNFSPNKNESLAYSKKYDPRRYLG